MRTCFTILLALLSLPVFAQTEQSPEVEAWIAKTLGGHIRKDFIGTEVTSGRPCALAITDKLYGHFFVTVGYYYTPEETERLKKNFYNLYLEDFVGISTHETFGRMIPDGVEWISSTSWGNRSTRNTVSVRLDKTGAPLEAKGVSDLQELLCRFPSTDNGDFIGF